MVAIEGTYGAEVVRDLGSLGMSAGRSPGSTWARCCARPGCPAGAEATLRFAYQAREAVIEPLGDEPQPQTYDLCGHHAARTRPPFGWTLRDLIPGVAPPEGHAEAVPVDLAGRDTMALFAAALDAAADAGARSTSGSAER